MKNNIKRLIVVGSSFMLIACGGGSANKQGSSNIPASPIIPIVVHEYEITSEPVGTTPFFIRDLPSGIDNEPPVNSNKWSFSVRHQGSDILSVPLIQNIDTISKTGMDLSINELLSGNGRGSFFRSYNNNFQSYIDTTSIPYETVLGGGPHSAIGYNFSTYPNVIGTTISGDFSISSLNIVGNSVGQLSIIGYMNDGDNHTIAFVFCIFDNRYTSFTPYVMSDTTVSFVSQPINGNTYATPISNEVMTNSTYTGFKNYGVTFTSQNLQKIIQDINEFNLNNNVPLVSTNIDNYKLTSVGVLHEVFLNNNPQNSIKMGISLKNIGAFSKG